jgi:uncharacterized protein YbbK (DUF523 family)
MKEKIICSACLLGENCRYNGRAKKSDKVLALARDFELLGVCPEVLGGLPTPRNPVEIRDGRAIDNEGNDLTKEFNDGAQEVLKIAKQYNIKKAILKQRSPSCGSGQLTMLDLSVIEGDGVTTKVLRTNGIEVISEEEL